VASYNIDLLALTLVAISD